MDYSDLNVKDSIRKEWDKVADNYDKKASHSIHSKAEKQAWMNIFQKVIPGKNLKILDAGCGTGELSVLLSQLGNHVTGLDISEQMIRNAREKAEELEYSIEFCIGDAEKSAFPDSIFDAVVIRHLIWTLPNPAAALREWNRILKQQGLLIVIDGLWDDGSLEIYCRHLLSKLFSKFFVLEGESEVTYNEKILSLLPNSGGLDIQSMENSFKEASFSNFAWYSLDHIRGMQFEKMPWYCRIEYRYPYYIAVGKKDLKEKIL